MPDHLLIIYTVGISVLIILMLTAFGFLVYAGLLLFGQNTNSGDLKASKPRLIVYEHTRME